MEPGRSVRLYREERVNTNGPGLKRVRCVSCSPDSGVGSKQKLARVCDSYAMFQRCSILMETWKARHNWNCDKCTHSGVKAIHTANMTNPRGKKDMPARGSNIWHSFRPSRLVMRRSVSRLSLSDNNDRWIRALKSSTAGSGRLYLCGTSLPFDFMANSLIL